MNPCAVSSTEVVVAMLKLKLEKKKYRKIKDLVTYIIIELYNEKNKRYELEHQLSLYRIKNIESKIPTGILGDKNEY